MIISPKKRSKQRDHHKESKKLGKDTLKRRRFWQDDFSQKVCEQQEKGKQTGEKRQKNTENEKRNKRKQKE